MNIISHGDQVRCGTYRLHSKFRSAVNFISGGDFVFVVNRHVGAGPLNLVLDDDKMDSLQSLVIGNDGCWLNDQPIALDAERRYVSTLCVEEFSRDRFHSNLNCFQDALVEFSPPQSLTFLLDNRRKQYFTSTFDREYVKRFEGAWNNIRCGDILSGIRLMKGLGPGLTPSGDDFISGLLIGLNVVQQVLSVDRSVTPRNNQIFSSPDLQVGEKECETTWLQPKNKQAWFGLKSFPFLILLLESRGYDYHDPFRNASCSKTIDAIARTAIGGNPFTNAFIRCAAQGRLSEKCRSLVLSLFHADKNKVISNTRRLMSIGETSGADQGVGLLLGFQMNFV